MDEPQSTDAAARCEETLQEKSGSTPEPDPFADHVFKMPCTEVKNVADMAKWSNSQGYDDYLGFILILNAAVKGKKLSSECTVSESTKALLNLLDILDGWIVEFPPIEQPQRFGNKAFRAWYEKLKKDGERLTADVLPDNLKRAAVEISDYLVEGFGNSTRIDYGTGHEASFVSFLCCLFKIRVLKQEDQVAIVLRVFNRYLQVVRKLQQTYRMEPAGSQGVWGLDDYQFLPFIWGSSQLFSHDSILPQHFVENNVVEKNRAEYMFLECIKYIMTVKTGPFAEHSNTLWGISGVPHWSKVNSGLIKMYKAEMLQKFPIIQHFRFGSILTLTPGNRKSAVLRP